MGKRVSGSFRISVFVFVLVFVFVFAYVFLFVFTFVFVFYNVCLCIGSCLLPARVSRDDLREGRFCGRHIVHRNALNWYLSVRWVERNGLACNSQQCPTVQRERLHSGKGSFGDIFCHKPAIRSVDGLFPFQNLKTHPCSPSAVQQREKSPKWPTMAHSDNLYRFWTAL